MSELKLCVLRDHYQTSTRTISVETKNDRIYVSTDIGKIEILNTVERALDEVFRGDLKLSAWSNPNVTYFKINESQKFALSFLLLLSYLQLSETRDMWKSLKPIPSKLISYIRDRSLYSEYILPYKAAMMKCNLRGYKIEDISGIQSTFEECGLSPHNYIYYVILCMTAHKITVDHSEPYSLNPHLLNKEVADFISEKQIIRLCNLHAHKKLRFICEANKIDQHDMATELLMGTMISYILIRPLKSLAYSENYARRSMTNLVTRIIHSYTHHPEKIAVWNDPTSESGVVYRNMSVGNHDVLNINNIVSTYDASSYSSSLLFNEDVMLEEIDRKRYEKIS